MKDNVYLRSTVLISSLKVRDLRFLVLTLKGATILRNVANQSPNDTASRPTRSEYSNQELLSFCRHAPHLSNQMVPHRIQRPATSPCHKPESQTSGFQACQRVGNMTKEILVRVGGTNDVTVSGEI